jgi:glycerol uptake facilitator-like aquaporin
MNRYLLEFLGTMFLSFIIFSTNNYLAIGAALSICILLSRGISTAAYNPAIAIVLLYSGKLPSNDLIPYILCEIAGAFAGFELVKLVLNRTT